MLALVRYMEMAYAVLLCVPLVALGPDRSSAQDTPRYREVIRQAVAEYEAGRMEEARAFFRQAHELEPNPRTLRGIGMTSYELRDYASAYAALSDALSIHDSARPLTAEHTAHIRQLLQRTLALIAIWASIPEGSTVRIDGRNAERDRDGSVIASLGGHDVDMTLADGRRAQFRIEVVGGERGAFPIDWALFGPAPPAEAGGVGVASTPDAEQSSEGAESVPASSNRFATTDGAPTAEQIQSLSAISPIPSSSDQVLEARIGGAPNDVERSEPSMRVGAAAGALAGGFGSGAPGWRAAVGMTGQVHLFGRLGPELSLGAVVLFDYASLAESDTVSESSWWLHAGGLVAVQLRFGALALILGAGGAAGVRDTSKVAILGDRVSTQRVDFAFPALVSARYFVIENLFLAIDGHVAVGDYTAAAGALLLGVEFQ